MGLDLYFIRKGSKRKAEQIGYFRKVNFLVAYFRDRGYNVENLELVLITKDDIIELLDRCNKVLENPSLAENLLPTEDGFFFGNTDYCQEYFEDLRKVKEYLVEELLPQFDTLYEDEKIYFQIWY